MPSNARPDKLILKSQANEVFAILSQAGLDASEFEWSKQPSTFSYNGSVSALIHRPTRYYFKFDFSDQGQWAEYSPGREKTIEVKHPGNWLLQMQEVALWAASLKREVDAPDLWAELTAGRQLIEGGSRENQDNHPLSPNDRAKLEASLREIREYAARALGATDDQLQILDQRLAYLQESSNRMGRKDWLLLAAGTLTNIVVAAAFAPDQARELFRFAGQALQWLILHPPLLP